MTNSRRVATASGAILADAAVLADAALLDDAALPDAAHLGAGSAAAAFFVPRFWARRRRLIAVGSGRGAAWFIDRGAEQWVLRHYRRGGFMARLSRDRYLWAGEDQVRAFAEYRLLASLAAQGLPVPAPVAARYERHGPWYRCDLITRRIAGAASLSGVLAAAPLTEAAWRGVGSMIARLHAAGVDHADLNAHNVLLDGVGAASMVDFDRGRIRGGGSWTGRNLDRLHRSLVKISAGLPADRFSADAWQSVLAGYSEHAAGHPERMSADP